MKNRPKNSPRQGSGAGLRGGQPPKKAQASRGVAHRESRQAAGFGEREGRQGPPRAKGPRIHMTVFGIHAVEAALLNPDREIATFYVTDLTEDLGYDLVEKAMKLGLDRPKPTLLEKQTFERALPKGTVHQGVGLDTNPLPEVYLSDVINRTKSKEKAVVVLLDQVTDPHNLGAVMRSACAFGAEAIIVQSRHAPELGGIVAKTACGAMEHIDVIYETNLARAIENLQENGFFAVALDERGEKTIGQAMQYAKTVLVLGAEGPGLRPLIRDKCDVLVKLPTSGALSSLNVSNAAAVALYAVSGDH